MMDEAGSRTAAVTPATTSTDFGYCGAVVTSVTVSAGFVFALIAIPIF
jgi:hypothetical protein